MQDDNEIIGDPEAGTRTDDYVDPEGPGPEDVPDPMDDAIAERPQAGGDAGAMDGQQPTG